VAASADKALSCYEALRGQACLARPEVEDQWTRVMRLIKAQWDILEGMSGAARAALGAPEHRDQVL
jgi:hypothetical protein